MNVKNCNSKKTYQKAEVTSIDPFWNPCYNIHKSSNLNQAIPFVIGFIKKYGLIDPFEIHQGSSVSLQDIQDVWHAFLFTLLSKHDPNAFLSTIGSFEIFQEEPNPGVLSASQWATLPRSESVSKIEKSSAFGKCLNFDFQWISHQIITSWHLHAFATLFPDLPVPKRFVFLGFVLTQEKFSQVVQAYFNSSFDDIPISDIDTRSFMNSLSHAALRDIISFLLHQEDISKYSSLRYLRPFVYNLTKFASSALFLVSEVSTLISVLSDFGLPLKHDFTPDWHELFAIYANLEKSFSQVQAFAKKIFLTFAHASESKPSYFHSNDGPPVTNKVLVLDAVQTKNLKNQIKLLSDIQMILQLEDIYSPSRPVFPENWDSQCDCDLLRGISQHGIRQITLIPMLRDFPDIELSQLIQRSQVLVQINIKRQEIVEAKGKHDFLCLITFELHSTKEAEPEPAPEKKQPKHTFKRKALPAPQKATKCLCFELPETIPKVRIVSEFNK